MKKNILIPVALLATTPFIVACTKKPADMPPPPPPVTGSSETINSVDEVVSAEVITPVTLVRTETVTYASPADPQDPIEFSVTVTDGVITSASATSKSAHEISQKLQSSFASEVSGKVVGKKAADLDVEVIGGASLTTAAFEIFVRSF